MNHVFFYESCLVQLFYSNVNQQSARRLSRIDFDAVLLLDFLHLVLDRV